MCKSNQHSNSLENATAGTPSKADAAAGPPEVEEPRAKKPRCASPSNLSRHDETAITNYVMTQRQSAKSVKLAPDEMKILLAEYRKMFPTGTDIPQAWQYREFAKSLGLHRGEHEVKNFFRKILKSMQSGTDGV